MDSLGYPKNVHGITGLFRQRMGLTWQRSASCYSHWASMWHESPYNHAQHHHHTHEANILALVYAGRSLKDLVYRSRCDQSNTQFIGQRVRVSWSSTENMLHVSELR